MRITFDHDQFDRLLADDEDLQHIDTGLRTLDMNNREHTRGRGLDLTFELVKTATTVGLHWQISELPDQWVDVFAGFPGAPDGTADVEYLEFQAYLTLGASIASVGTDSIRSLLDTDGPATAVGILDGIARLLARIANDLASLFAATMPEPPVEQRVVPIDGIRAEADDNPNLTETERAALSNATDTQIADALAAHWRGVEDLFFQVHDELQSDAVSALTDAAE